MGHLELNGKSLEDKNSLEMMDIPKDTPSSQAMLEMLRFDQPITIAKLVDCGQQSRASDKNSLNKECGR